MAAFKKALIEWALGPSSAITWPPPGGTKPDAAVIHRNGSTGKTVLTEDGPLRIAVLRDRASNFEPFLTPKHERRCPSFDGKTVGMYAHGMFMREIQGFCTRVKIREDAVVRDQAVYLALAVPPDGSRDILGLWIEGTEGATLKVFKELETRCVDDGNAPVLPTHTQPNESAMATSLVRYTSPAQPEQTQWGVLFDGRIAPLPSTYATTADLIRHGQAQARAMTASQAAVHMDEVTILSPITTNQQFLCQGINYGSHVRESGMDPANVPFNSFFTKASSSLTGPFDDVIRPAHVELLDYEIELGLVLGRDLASGIQVEPDRLHEVLAGITIVNDVSARDVQLPQGQFYKGKSYRTFGPVGPVLLLLEPAEWQRWPELHMQLSVNGQVRQDAYCCDMLHQPHATVSEFSALQDLNAGDLIATGTPAGCAAKAPGKLLMFVANRILSDSTKWKLFVKGGLRNPMFLQPNDMMTLSIRTDDGALDLGQQRNVVVSA